MPPEDHPDDRPPPLPSTLAEYATAIDWYRAKLSFYTAMAGQVREMLATLERRRELLRRGLLPKVLNKGTLGTMEAQQANAGSKVSAAKTKHPWPFSAALHAHGSSPAQWAEAKKGRPPAETVRAWLKRPGKGGRPVPRRWADEIEAEFAETETPVPARDESWPNKIR